MREKIIKSAREKFWLYVKTCKKVCVKAIFVREKTQKKAEKSFTHTFGFHAGKKKLNLSG